MRTTSSDTDFIRYPFHAYANGDHWHIVFPDLPGCHTSADTWEEISTQARQVFESWMDTMAELGKPIPPPTTGDPGNHWGKEAIYSVEEVAERFNLTPRRIRAIATRRGIGHRLADVLFFTESDIDKLKPGPPGRPRNEERSMNTTYRVGVWKFGYNQEYEGTNASDFEAALNYARVRLESLGDDAQIRIIDPEGEPIYTIDHTGEADYRKR